MLITVTEACHVTVTYWDADPCEVPHAPRLTLSWGPQVNPDTSPLWMTAWRITAPISSLTPTTHPRVFVVQLVFPTFCRSVSILCFVGWLTPTLVLSRVCRFMGWPLPANLHKPDNHQSHYKQLLHHHTLTLAIFKTSFQKKTPFCFQFLTGQETKWNYSNVELVKVFLHSISMQ